MAERIEVELVDDVDGSPAQQTVTFALDGVSYEIDLSQRHAQQLRSVLAGYIDHARTPKSGSRATKQQEREERRVRRENRKLTEHIRGAAQRTREQRKAQESAEGAERTVEDDDAKQTDGREQDPSAESLELAVRADAASQYKNAPETSESDQSTTVPAVSLPQFSSAAD